MISGDRHGKNGGLQTLLKVTKRKEKKYEIKRNKQLLVDEKERKKEDKRRGHP